MTQHKLTKNALREQRAKRDQLTKYLPILELKKGLLQGEVDRVREELTLALSLEKEAKDRALSCSGLLEGGHQEDRILKALTIVEIKQRHDHMAGIDLLYLEEVILEGIDPLLTDLPIWMEGMVGYLGEALIAKKKREGIEERLQQLAEALREVSTRVNLFEKVLIPRCHSYIKRIKLFLSEQDLAAIAQAKVAKKNRQKGEEIG
ncbi:MAG: V-type ATP synthase subunit D [Chlamydiota bacterium]|nr:V-type ATP synthase subunit D [Chlamydiota bacterium]